MSENTASSPTAGYQNWRHLVFLHWKVDPEQLQRHLPEGLTVETFDDAAWLALVPFAMERVRPWWAPPIPGVSWFLETNVRTYVRHESGIRAVLVLQSGCQQSAGCLGCSNILEAELC